MKCLIVVAHPLEDSLCKKLAQVAIDALEQDKHSLRSLDLYRTAFMPVLTMDERASYFSAAFRPDNTHQHLDDLQWAETLVLVFPTWWYGFPAILKGWFDRVWAPGVAFDHNPKGGALKPRLTTLRNVVAITTLGSPLWVDRLILGQPVKRVLSRAILMQCASRCRLRFFSVYQAETMTPARFAQAATKIRKLISQLR